jgi:hypothetical protein
MRSMGEMGERKLHPMMVTLQKSDGVVIQKELPTSK